MRRTVGSESIPVSAKLLKQYIYRNFQCYHETRALAVYTIAGY